MNLKHGDNKKAEIIDEIAKDLCSKYTICTCNDRNGKCSTPQQHARILYELGYRKPRRGAWILDFTFDGSNFYKCSVCGRQEILLAKENVSEWFPFCHCGSQMTDDPLALKLNEDRIRFQIKEKRNG